MTVFDKINRSDTRAARYTDSHFHYLNYSAREAAQMIRNTIENWFLSFPNNCKDELRARFRSNNDTHFLSAYFELYLYSLLKKLECKIEIHPSIQTVGTKPDFLVYEDEKETWFLEATLTKDQSDEKEAAEARKRVVYDSINKLDNSDFFIGMDLKGDPETPPPGKRIRSFLNGYLRELDVDVLRDKLNTEGFDSMPRWSFEHEGWRIVFYPIPKSKSARGKKDGSSIGIMNFGARWIDTSSSIKSSIKKKASKYGDMDIPYVVAIDCMGLAVDKESIIDALFGKQKFVYKISDNGKPIGEPEAWRDLDGVLFSPKGPINTRISGVLVGFGITPWNRTESSLMLYHNPYCQKPLVSRIRILDEAIPNENGTVDFKIGTPAHEILGLNPIPV